MSGEARAEAQQAAEHRERARRITDQEPMLEDEDGAVAFRRGFRLAWQADVDAIARAAFAEDAGWSDGLAEATWDKYPDDHPVKAYWRRIMTAALLRGEPRGE